MFNKIKNMFIRLCNQAKDPYHYMLEPLKVHLANAVERNVVVFDSDEEESGKLTTKLISLMIASQRHGYYSQNEFAARTTGQWKYVEEGEAGDLTHIFILEPDKKSTTSFAQRVYFYDTDKEGNHIGEERTKVVQIVYPRQEWVSELTTMYIDELGGTLAPNDVSLVIGYNDKLDDGHRCKAILGSY